MGPGPKSPKIIRAAKRMAARLQAELIAVFVETPQLGKAEEFRNKALQNLRLAEQLGAETKILTGVDIVKEIINFARERNVTKIVLGKIIRPRWKDLLFGSLVDELVRNSGEIDIYIIHGTAEHTSPPILAPTKLTTPFKYYIITFGIITIATLFNFILSPYVELSNLVMVYLLGIVVVALFGRTGPSNLASILSVLALDYFFIPPLYSFTVENVQYWITLMIMFLVSQVISHLTILSRHQVEAVGLAENRTSALLSLTRQLSTSRGTDKLLAIAVRYISEMFDSEVLVLLPDNSHLTIRARYHSTQLLNAKEQSIAEWVYELGQIAGLGTQTLSSSDALYVPLLGSQGTVGVLRVRPNDSRRFFAPEKMRFLEACANQIALALEVDRLQEQAKKSEFQAQTVEVRNALLQSVSHDLRTPIISIMGSASMLNEAGKDMDAHTLNKLSNDIYNESEQLGRLINNLLQITYLEAEAVRLQKEPHSLRDTIDIVIHSLHRELGKRPIHIHVSNDLPRIPFDKILLEQVLENLIDNATKFTPPKSPIDITAKIDNKNLVVSIEDHGPGISKDEVDKLFEKFYRGRMLTTERGLGLGLALCRHIIKAHGGEIWAENRPEGGAVFRFTIPL